MIDLFTFNRAARQRFFVNMVMSAKVEETFRIARLALDQGKCMVIGLQNTGEAPSEHVDRVDERQPVSSAEGTVR